MFNSPRYELTNFHDEPSHDLYCSKYKHIDVCLSEIRQSVSSQVAARRGTINLLKMDLDYVSAPIVPFPMMRTVKQLCS